VPEEKKEKEEEEEEEEEEEGGKEKATPIKSSSPGRWEKMNPWNP